MLLDINEAGQDENATKLQAEFGVKVQTHLVDITDVQSVFRARDEMLNRFQRIDILINNAARNPRVGDGYDDSFLRLENFPGDQWKLDLDVGLGGAFICCKVFGAHMVQPCRCNRASGGQLPHNARGRDLRRCLQILGRSDRGCDSWRKQGDPAGITLHANPGLLGSASVDARNR